MPLWNALSYVLLALFVVLLPVGVIGLTASKLSPAHRTAFLALYGGAVLLLGMVVLDVTNAMSNRAATDLALLGGGVVVGFFAGRLFRLTPHDPA